MPSHRQTNGRPNGGQVETVDLTFDSSPEPERKPTIKPGSLTSKPSSTTKLSSAPQHQQYQRHGDKLPAQQRLPGHSTTSRGVAPATTAGASSSSSRRPAAAARLPHVPSDHLRQLITSTPPHKVADLLVELCKASPALSGAVARGLAPHSIWAQATIRDYQSRNGISQIKRQPTNTPSSSAAIARPSHTNRNYASPQTPHPRTSAKFEVDVLEPDSDDSLSDLDALPGRFSRSEKGKAVAGPSSSNHRRPTSPVPSYDASPSRRPSALSVRIKPEPKSTTIYCIQCDKRVERGSRCRFHIGRAKTLQSGSRKTPGWACCNKPQGSIGCCDGDHIPMRDINGTENTPSSGNKRIRLT